MRLVIDRGPTADVGTFGHADANGVAWDSLELPWRGNAPNLSCIPPGIYKAIALHSLKFGRMVYRLLAVPGRMDVEIHPANWAGDVEKGLHSDLEGCLALGETVGMLTTPGPDGKPQEAVEHSATALDRLFDMTGGADIEVEIRWSPGNDPGDYDPSGLA